MNWYFVRHGEIESNIKKIYAGWSEEGLTRKGRQEATEATEAAETLIDFNIDSIYTSPLKRAVQTAEIIGGILNKQPIKEESFKEMRLGIWEGMGEEEIQRDYPDKWKIWTTSPAVLILEGRETLQELLERVLAGLKRVKQREVDGSVLVVTHVAIIRVLLLYVGKMDLNLYRTIPVHNAKIFELADKLLSY